MILAILQARVSSSRLPGKILMPILGEPMLLRQIERVQRCRKIDRLLVATSTDVSDDPLAAICIERKIEIVRGSLEDVLDRFVMAARPLQPESIVRLTGDCPLADPELIDNVIKFFHDGYYDYAANTQPPTFPDGLDVEVVRYACLETAHREAVLPSHREHVTLFLCSHPERFRLGNYSSKRDYSHLRWTVDEPEDLEFVRKIYQYLYPLNPSFSTEDVMALLKDKPSLIEINSHFERNEGLKKSLQQDENFLRNR